MSSINDNDVVSVWMDISVNGRAAGSITEMSYVYPQAQRAAEQW